MFFIIIRNDLFYMNTDLGGKSIKDPHQKELEKQIAVKFFGMAAPLPFLLQSL